MNKEKIPDAYEKDLMLSKILNVSREYILARKNILRLNSLQQKKFDQMIERRKKQEPLAYILEEKEFFGLTFAVTSATLIPRPETELLVEKILSLPQNFFNRKTAIIDVGTGSGNIIVSLAKNFLAREKNLPIFFYGVDISKASLAIAQKNARQYKIAEKIKFAKSDLLKHFFRAQKNFSPLPDSLLIVANLPYLSKKIYEKTPLSVKKYEPKIALMSQKFGLEHYQRLFKEISQIKRKYEFSSIKIFLEFSPEQKKRMEIATRKEFPLAEISFQKDLSEKWRILQINI